MPISLETLQQILEAGRIQDTFHPTLRMPRNPKKQKFIDNATPDVYTLDNLSDLINRLHTITEEHPNDPLKYSIRYLMTDDNSMLFAQEGRADGTIPRHRDMSSRCIAAGNLFLSQDLETIVGINHDSGDFKPTTASLIWPLKILANTEQLSARLDDASDFSIHYRAHAMAEIETLTVPMPSLHAMLANISRSTAASATASNTAASATSSSTNTAHSFFSQSDSVSHAIANHTDDLDLGYATP